MQKTKVFDNELSRFAINITVWLCTLYSSNRTIWLWRQNSAENRNISVIVTGFDRSKRRLSEQPFKLHWALYECALCRHCNKLDENQAQNMEHLRRAILLTYCQGNQSLYLLKIIGGHRTIVASGSGYFPLILWQFFVTVTSLSKTRQCQLR